LSAADKEHEPTLIVFFIRWYSCCGKRKILRANNKALWMTAKEGNEFTAKARRRGEDPSRTAKDAKVRKGNER
jgi:hypothetical protein